MKARTREKAHLALRELKVPTSNDLFVLIEAVSLRSSG